jgi:predicted enzyme related to lactoylglutathione lyase
MNIRTIVYPVADLAAAKAVYEALAGSPTVDSPYYVGYQLGDTHFGLAPRRSEDDVAVNYWDVPDIEATITTLTSNGAKLLQSPTNVGGGRQIAVLADPDGNRIGLTHDSV